MRKSWIAAAILAMLSAACTRESKPLDLNDSSQFLHIDVTEWNADGNRGPSGDYRIEDRERIESIFEALRSNNAGYREDTDWSHWRLFGGERSPMQYSLLFQKSLDTAALMGVSFGSDWLSGTDEQKNDRGFTYFRTRPLSASEREALLALIARRPEDRGR